MQRPRKLRCDLRLPVLAGAPRLFSEPSVIAESLLNLTPGDEPIGQEPDGTPVEHQATADQVALDGSPAIAGPMYRGMIDLNSLAGCYRSRWQGRRLRHVLRLMQNDRPIVHPGDHTYPRYRLYPGNSDDAIDTLFVSGLVHVLVLGDVLYALDGLVFVGRVNLSIRNRPIAIGTAGCLSLVRLGLLGLGRDWQANRNCSHDG